MDTHASEESCLPSLPSASLLAGTNSLALTAFDGRQGLAAADSFKPVAVKQENRSG
jgi:hypothetical protein